MAITKESIERMGKHIDEANRRLIRAAQKYPDRVLADAVDEVRLIVRQQQEAIMALYGKEEI